MKYREYLQFLENNPEHKERKLKLIFSLFYPIAKELKEIPLYSLRLPILIFKEVKNHKNSANFKDIQEFCRDIYSSDKIIHEDFLIDRIKEHFQIPSISFLNKINIRTDEFHHFLKDETMESKNFGTLTNYRYKNVEYFIERFSSYLETELSLPKDHVLEGFYKSKHEWDIPLINKSKDLEEDLAIALYTFCYITFRKDDLFLSKISQYQESIKLVS
tara:strand:- start:1969 stop:2619 length:651 start_codon:yes stop_codon:yes gene_type:complete